MPDIPAAAVQAAAEVLLRDYEDLTGTSHLTWQDFAGLARRALGAAAPALGEHAAQKITAHKYAHEPGGPLIGGKTAEEQRRRTWRRHFSIAARVAARAFMADEDLKREAAAALNRGDFAACYLDDDGNPVAGKRKDGERADL